MQAPAPSQWSSVQPLPSSVQPVVAGWKQFCAVSLQWLAHSEPPVHGSPAWTLQPPPEQVSAPLQNIPSSQLAAFAVCVHPFASAPGASGSHASLVQTFPSLQSPGQNLRLSMTAVWVWSVPDACQVKYVMPMNPAGAVTTPLAAGVMLAPEDAVK